MAQAKSKPVRKDGKIAGKIGVYLPEFDLTYTGEQEFHSIEYWRDLLKSVTSDEPDPLILNRRNETMIISRALLMNAIVSIEGVTNLVSEEAEKPIVTPREGFFRDDL